MFKIKISNLSLPLVKDEDSISMDGRLNGAKLTITRIGGTGVNS